LPGDASMTALQLLTYICAALLLQIASGFGVIVWRKRALVAQPAQPDGLEARALSAGAWSGWRDFRVKRRSFEDLARSQCSFCLQPVDGVPLAAFKPGQYLTFSLQVGDGEAGAAGTERSLTRCYSLSDGPDPANFRITVKRMLPPPDRPDLPPGASSSHFHDRVQEGDVLKVKAPAGHFFIDPDATAPAVFIAGGIGITPMMSMLRWCVAKQPERVVHLYYGVRSSADHAFKQTLEALAESHPALELHMVYSRPGPDDVQGRDYQHAGYIDLELLRSSLPHGRRQFYVCGPPPMMQSLVPALRGWGVKEGDIHFEAFGPASVRPAGPATKGPATVPSTSFEVRLTGSGRTLVWDGRDANLLDFAERHGVAVDSGCRSGSCGTCETKLASGTVHYPDKPDFDIAIGHCLLCVGKPHSALVLEA
jgi:uncharacterized protein